MRSNTFRSSRLWGVLVAAVVIATGGPARAQLAQTAEEQFIAQLNGCLSLPAVAGEFPPDPCFVGARVGGTFLRAEGTNGIIELSKPNGSTLELRFLAADGSASLESKASIDQWIEITESLRFWSRLRIKGHAALKAHGLLKGSLGAQVPPSPDRATTVELHLNIGADGAIGEIEPCIRPGS